MLPKGDSMVRQKEIRKAAQIIERRTFDEQVGKGNNARGRETEKKSLSIGRGFIRVRGRVDGNHVMFAA